MCRLLLPGACEPRQTLLGGWASSFGLVTAYAATATGARLSLATVLCAPITVVAHRDKANPFRRPSILFRPRIPPTKGSGGAAGYRPRVRSAYYGRVYVHSRHCCRHREYRHAGANPQGRHARPRKAACTAHIPRQRRENGLEKARWNAPGRRVSRAAACAGQSPPLSSRCTGGMRRSRMRGGRSTSVEVSSRPFRPSCSNSYSQSALSAASVSSGRMPAIPLAMRT